jgi:nucleoid-associated protein YgaU
LPTFDVVRVESNGSVVVAGNAAPNAKVEILNGGTVLGSTDAGPDGAFAIVLDDPLKPGDYTITLRSTVGGTAVASAQTAVVSVPQSPTGQVLAMVEEPGKASQLITVPQAAETKPAATAATDQSAPAAQAPAAAPAPTAPATAAAPAAAAPAASDQAAAPATAAPAAVAAEPKIAVEAVEIDGGKVFVAGTADPGRKVRAYADDILLGEAKTSPDGHFLIEAARDIPVGNHTIHVDGLGDDGVKVVARAAVPFEREPGESIAAVAPSETKPAEAKPAEAKPAATAAQATAEASKPATAQTPAAEATAPAASAAEAPAKVAEATPSADVPETVAPKLEHADGAVIIRRNDTLWRISRRVYGHGVRYSTIYLANQDQIRDPDRIWPGQVFKVPGKSKEGEPADLKAMGDQMTAPKTE